MYFSPAGTVLVYVVVLMLIFGVLGVVMVSLFSSSIASSITRNDSRRALHMAESGMRYAFSEIRKADFDLNVMIDPLNTTTYTVTDGGSFSINVFSPWFESSANQAIPSGDLSLNVPIGELPDGYTIPASGIYAINYEFTGNNLADESGSSALVTNFDPAFATMTLSDDFNASSGERVSLAVFPKQAQNIDGPGRNLEFTLEAQTIFPKYGGAISIIKNGPNRGGIHEYFYEQRIDYPPADNRVVLRNLTAAPGTVGDAYPMPVTTSDWIILSPRNYLVAPTGQSDGTTYGGDFTLARGIFDASLLRPGSAPPDITADEFTSDLSVQEDNTQFFEVDSDEDRLRIGGGLTDQFGSAFYASDESIGGDQDYCQQGACKFALGIRAFFLLNFSQQGDGITFTLLSKGFGALGPPNNSASSVGGDFQLSELLGYAGDSRLDAAGTTFLATNPDDRGLDPPKIAVEFDTRTNNTAGDPPPDYCSGADANTDSRNDPLAANKDAVQYVFWGRTSFLNIPCRDNNTLYDDNRHDADGEEPTEEWRFGTGGTISFWRPAIGSDGTIYVTAQDATLYALDQDGSTKWTFPLGDNNDYMPGIDTKGTPDPSDDVIYSDISGNNIVAIDSGGNQLWQFNVGSDIDSTPTVGPDGRVYFGTDFGRSLFAIDPGARAASLPFPQAGEWQFLTGGGVNTVPALSPDASVVYMVSNDNNLYAVNTSDGTERWRFPILTEPNEIQSSPIVNPSTGTVYVGADDNNVYALNPAARTAGLPFPQADEWAFATGGEIESSAALDPVDGTIYIGSDDQKVWAIGSNGIAKPAPWPFVTNGNVESSPIVDLNGTIFIGSNDGKFYAINPDGTERWNFPTGGGIPSSPVFGLDGFIRIGSNDFNLYTLSQYGDPRNFKDEDQNLGKLLTVEDLDSSVLVNSNTDWLNGAGSRGSWAVRLEVDRALLPNVDGKFDYELRLWMRQCPDTNDIPCDTILGTFYQDTRFEYDYTAVADLPMSQGFSLSGAEQDAFESFYFGFTAASGAQALDATISQFQLSFIRPGDPVVDCDRANWPLEDSPPLPDCLLID